MAEQDGEERKPFFPLVVAALLFAALLVLVFFLREEAQQLSADGFSANYLGFLFLINGNIILVMLFGFLVVKNVVKLVLDRNRGLLGSQLRTRLVVAFVGLALVPTILLFFISRGIISSVFQYWFSPQVTAAVDGALAIAKYQYESLEEDSKKRSEIFSKRLESLLPLLVDAKGVLGGQDALRSEEEEGKRILEKLLEEKRKELGFFEASVYRRDGSRLASVRDEQEVGTFAENIEPNLQQLSRAAHGEGIIRLERSASGELIRSYLPILRNGEVAYLLVTSTAATGQLGQLLSQVLDAYEDYRELRSYRIPLTSTYTLTLVVVSLLILFAAVWVGFYLARTISGPIQLLAEGTQQVARGNLSHRIPDVGKDEMRMLVDSFNRMTGDLSRTTGELEERRHYMETVLQSVGVGVLSLDENFHVTTCNGSAKEILSLAREPVGESLESLEAADLLGFVKGLLNQNSTEPLRTGHLALIRDGRSRHLQITVSALAGETGGGLVVLLDDLTELVQAQRTAAWEEVARRMAHEIKNPLTPIQLSAERIERRVLASGQFEGDERRILLESTDTIARAVDSLRNLVNEFSRFSRLPKARPEPLELRGIVERVASTFRERHPKIHFQIGSPEVRTDVRADREQMEAVFTNLFENATYAIGEESEGIVHVEFESRPERLLIRVADTGCGVPDEYKQKLFEPYFSNRKGGTGLGLAIVNSILTEQSGRISVRDHLPRGAIFEIELPRG